MICGTELRSLWQHQEKGAIFAKVKRIKVGKDPRTDQQKRTLRTVIERVRAFRQLFVAMIVGGRCQAMCLCWQVRSRWCRSRMCYKP